MAGDNDNLSYWFSNRVNSFGPSEYTYYGSLGSVVYNSSGDQAAAAAANAQAYAEYRKAFEKALQEQYVMNLIQECIRMEDVLEGLP